MMYPEELQPGDIVYCKELHRFFEEVVLYSDEVTLLTEQSTVFDAWEYGFGPQECFGSLPLENIL